MSEDENVIVRLKTLLLSSTGRNEDFLRLLESFWQEQQQQFLAQWRRSLPFADTVVDRWRKAALLGFGEGASIYDSAYVFGDVSVGNNTWIGPFTVLDGSGGLRIGSNCSISAGVQLYTHDSVRWAISAGEAPLERAPTTIGSNCYLGPNVVVAKGVTIGDRCVVGANSLVLSDLPPNSKAFGTPCKVTGRVDAEDPKSST